MLAIVVEAVGGLLSKILGGLQDDAYGLAAGRGRWTVAGGSTPRSTTAITGGNLGGGGLGQCNEARRGRESEGLSAEVDGHFCILEADGWVQHLGAEGGEDAHR
ncbi:hypothetical protein Vafri_7485 [Volvox africanus]|uniref:Uncharacterized protein n=1 Tax=Volvox africanus TaxID=51714 RepID=A0A8J4EX13_9CHLO|nr:hypothetical protein Vafri_7485 [Volvox africanus]